VAPGQCDDVGQGNDCCYMAPGPPEFWCYPFDSGNVFAGESVVFAIPDPANLTHVFEVFQAQVLHSCESHDLRLSWAVSAEF
jgi:hypothetical protein